MDSPLCNVESRIYLQQLLDDLLILRDDIVKQAQLRLAAIPYQWPAQDRENSAKNLSTYLAFRRHDIRPLQDQLAQLGLSSLGRGESNILDNIERVMDLLVLATGCNRYDFIKTDWPQNGFSGRGVLSDRNTALFGESENVYYTRIMTTLPSESADEYEVIKGLMAAGMNCARINCAHDNAKSWRRMVSFIGKAKEETGKECKIFMDLAGMKIRTGPIGARRGREAKIRLHEGEKFELRCDVTSSVPESVNPKTNETRPAIIACSSDAMLGSVRVGESVWIDDGKLGSTIEEVFEQGMRLRVTHAGPKGIRIKAGKGINFPNTRLSLPTLSQKDLHDLDFVCDKADILGISFVQSAADLEDAISELTRRGSTMPIAAKIETRMAVDNLPDIIFKGLSYPGGFGVMVARGDLAVEVGSVRMAEIQEEILWLCEAAHVPVIWATQVLESLAKKGIVSRPEITDAAMSVRAECVMLNKGEYITSAVEILRNILDRMQAHQYKKVSRLRALRW